MSTVRVCCPECKRAFAIPIEAQEFSCPRCGRQIHIIPTGKTLGWFIDPGPDIFRSQVIRPMDELLDGNPRGRGPRTEGAARARKLIRDQHRKTHFNPARLLASFLVLLGLVAWYMFNPVIGNASSGAIIPVTGQNTQELPAPSPTSETTSIADVVALPAPTSTPSPTATALPEILIQATARQAALDQAIANSYIQQTANAARYQATQTAISVRFTEVVGVRQAGATATAQAKRSP